MIKRRAALLLSLLTSFASWPAVMKAETRKFRHVSELRDLIIGRLNRLPEINSAIPDASDAAKINIQWGDWSMTGDITNLFQYLQAYPEGDTDIEIDKWLRTITEIGGRAPSNDNLVAVVRTLDYIEDGTRMGMEFVQEPLIADLVITYMIDMPNSLSPVSPDDVEGKELEFLHTLALENIRKWLPKVIADIVPGSGVLYYVDGNTSLSPSLILLNEFWTSISPDFPGDVLIALPRRDQLFVFNTDQTAEAMRIIEATTQENYNLLSDKLYARRNGRFMLADN